MQKHFKNIVTNIFHYLKDIFLIDFLKMTYIFGILKISTSTYNYNELIKLNKF